MVAQNIPIEPYSRPVSQRHPNPCLLQHEVEQLLYLEARLLDDWNLDAWLTLYTPDARYVSCRRRTCRRVIPASDLVFIDDDYRRMQGRVVRLAEPSCAPGIPVVSHAPVHLQCDGHCGGRKRTRCHVLRGRVAIPGWGGVTLRRDVTTLRLRRVDGNLRISAGSARCSISRSCPTTGR